MKTSLYIISMAVILFHYACNKNPSDPREIPKDPRQHTWTVDTLAYPGSFQTSMDDIWGESTKDVYVVGHNGQAFGKMYHFDGKAWNPVRITVLDGGTIGGVITLYSIYGFAANDIWAVGQRSHDNPKPPPRFIDSSLVIHYDGKKWTEVNIRPRRRLLQNVWGTSSNNLYAVGSEGVILHYDGLKWSTQLLSPPAQLQYLGGDANRLFAGGHLFGRLSDMGVRLDSIVTFTNSGDGWKLLDSQPFLSELPRFGESDFYSPAPGVYYSVGLGIFRWQGTRWEKIYASEVYLNDIYGTGTNNIFAIGQFGKVYHWNGSDWALLNLPFDKIPSDIWFTGVWTDGKETFICGFGHVSDGATVTFILHGK